MAKRETLINATEITRSFYTKAGNLRTVEPGKTVTVGADTAARLEAHGFKPKPKEKKVKKPTVTTGSANVEIPTMAPEVD